MKKKKCKLNRMLDVIFKLDLKKLENSFCSQKMNFRQEENGRHEKLKEYNKMDGSNGWCEQRA